MRIMHYEFQYFNRILSLLILQIIICKKKALQTFLELSQI